MGCIGKRKWLLLFKPCRLLELNSLEEGIQIRNRRLVVQGRRNGGLLCGPPHVFVFIVSLPYKSNMALCQNIQTLQGI